MRLRTLLNRLLLLFWSLYFSLVAGSNIVNGLQEAGLAPRDWTFTSGNLGMIVATVSKYGLSAGVAGFLFVLVILLELAAALWFWMSISDSLKSDESGATGALRAFVPAVGLFAGFLVADEFFIVYDRIADLETSHLLVLCALLLSLIVIDRKSAIDSR